MKWGDSSWAAIPLRVMVGIILVVAGYLKLTGMSGAITFFTNQGFPLPLVTAWFVALLEFVGGLALIAGFLVRYLAAIYFIEFIVAAAACFAFTAGGLRIVLELGHGWAPELLLSALATFSFLEHYNGLTRGVLDLRDIVFFLSSIAFFLFSTVVAVERNKGA